jgi:hypothetical protein
MNKVGRIAVLFALLVLVSAPPASAQSPWSVEFPTFIGLAEGNVLVTVGAPSFAGCDAGSVLVNLPDMPKLKLWSVVVIEDEGAPTTNLHWVVTPLGVQNITWQTGSWIRVFPLAEGDLDDYLQDPCGFYGTREFIAEGVAQFSYHSADDALTGPGVNTWGFTIHGALIDSGYCPGGTTPHFTWIQKWVGKSQTDYTSAKSTASKGPSLVCR